MTHPTAPPRRYQAAGLGALEAHMFINVPHTPRSRFLAVGHVKFTRHPEVRLVNWYDLPWLQRAEILARGTRYWIQDLKETGHV